MFTQRASLLAQALTCGVILAASGCGGHQAADPAQPQAAQPQAANSTPAAQAPAQTASGPAAQSGTAAAAGDAQISASDKAMAERAAGMMEQMAKIAESAPKDCHGAATKYKQIIDKNRDVMAAGKDFTKDPAKKKWFEDTYRDRMMAAVGKMMPLIQNCQNDPEFQKAMASMK